MEFPKVNGKGVPQNVPDTTSTKSLKNTDQKISSLSGKMRSEKPPETITERNIKVITKTFEGKNTLNAIHAQIRRIKT